MPTKERIDVFISSTSYDLPEHRRAVIEALNLLKLQPNGMEYWSVTDQDPVALCKRQVEDSEVFIGIYAHRYGWCPPGYAGKSITEMEYDWAETVERDGKPIPRFCFMIDKAHPITIGMVEADKTAELERFKARVLGRHVGFFKSVEDLKAQVIAALATWKADRALPTAPADTPLSTARKSTVTDRNREILLKKVHEFWIEGYLNKSMIDDVWLDLPAAERPEAVEPIIARKLNDGATKPFLLTADTNIGALFRATERALLILGAPGAGKTITLLELAKDLLDEAEHDPRKPIPVVLNLASWAEKQPERLEDWLIERLDRDYGVSRKAGTRWIANGELLFLLDGLDEVADAHRKSCVTAINAYWKRAQALGENGIAVCSRIQEYDLLSIRLHVQQAVQLQALALAQAQSYLSSLGAAWDGLRQAIYQDAVLEDMAKTPLLLNIMAVAYRDKSASQITGFADEAAQHKHLFDQYVSQRLSEEAAHPKYTREQTRHFLAWLARGLEQKDQIVFHIEDLRLAWLNEEQKRRAWRLNGWFSLVGGLVYGNLLTGLVGGLVYGNLLTGLGFGLLCALMIGRTVSNRMEEPRFTDRLSLPWDRLVGGLVGGLLVGLVLGLWIGWYGELFTALFVGLLGGLFTVPFVALKSNEFDLKSHPNESVRRSLQNGLVVMLLVGLFGLVVGLSFGLFGLVVGLLFGLFGLVVGLLFGLFVGLLYGLAVVIVHAILRRVLWHTGDAPINYAEFLKYTTSRHLTRQIGGGFIFRHRLLMEHFAESDW